MPDLMNRSNKRSYMYRENTDFQKDTERNETKRILASPSSILQYSIRRLIEFVEKKKRKEKENYQMKISLRSNIRSIRVFRSFEYNQTFSNIVYRGERGREKKKETAENRKEQLDKVRRKVRGKGRDQEPRSLGE